MEMLKAIIRPEKEKEVVGALADAGFVSLTKQNVFGRGKQKGIQVGSIHYDELPKTLITVVVEDSDTAKVISVIEGAARTGNVGDGKIFVSPVAQAYTIRTGAEGL